MLMPYQHFLHVPTLWRSLKQPQTFPFSWPLVACELRDQQTNSWNWCFEPSALTGKPGRSWEDPLVVSGNRNQSSSLAVSWRNTCLTQKGWKSKKENQKKRMERTYCTWVTGIVVAKRSDQKKLMHTETDWGEQYENTDVGSIYAHQEKVRLPAHFVEVST